MRNYSQEDQYAGEIAELILQAFDKESEEQRWDINKIDATAWFTGLVKASAYIYNKLTDDDKNLIEWTHLSHNLVIQHMMEKDKAS